MRIALAQTNSIWTGPTCEPVEPASLVGMNNQLIRAGHHSRILHNPTGNHDTLLAQIDDFGPSIVGLSATPTPSRRGISAWGEPIADLKAKGVTVLMGGKDPTIDAKQYAEEARPDVIVLGPGEPVMATPP